MTLSHEVLVLWHCLYTLQGIYLLRSISLKEKFISDIENPTPYKIYIMEKEKLYN